VSTVPELQSFRLRTLLFQYPSSDRSTRNKPQFQTQLHSEQERGMTIGTGLQKLKPVRCHNEQNTNSLKTPSSQNRASESCYYCKCICHQTTSISRVIKSHRLDFYLTKRTRSANQRCSIEELLISTVRRTLK